MKARRVGIRVCAFRMMSAAVLLYHEFGILCEESVK